MPESTPERQMRFSTRSLHAGQKPDPATGARAVDASLAIKSPQIV